MAYDKVVDSAALDANLTAIADAIREKAGTSDAMTLAGMAEAIAAISAGGGKVTYGTITPTSQLSKIEHNLGVKPYMFMWLITFNHTMTGQVMSSTSSISEREQAYDSADISYYKDHKTRQVFITMNNKFYSYSAGAYTDWGFFVVGSLEELSSSYDDIELNENEFISGRKTGSGRYPSIIPCDKNGNVTIHWFAFGA